MPLIDPYSNNPAVDARQSETAMEIRRGILNGFQESDLVFVPEFTLPGGRRADLIGLDGKGQIVIIEIKSSVADFNADNKWPEYKEFSDRFYFASHPSVPGEIFPETEGFILADQYGCEIIRDSDTRKLPAPTRKSLTLKIARAAASRLQLVSEYAAKLD
ncbi:MAG: MmcB family DNA repair protein [Rhizobiaceae bacterium]|nr:MmcB family DNA repair protein [Rhizobiaceae bacterium]